MITVNDSALNDWPACCFDDVAHNRQRNMLRVYPNPANNTLNVDLPTANTNVAIYSSTGIKIDETVVEGTNHIFNVSNYSPKVYFVKANNSVVKFVK